MNFDFYKYIHDKKILLIVGGVLLICLLIVFSLAVISREDEYIAIPPTAAYVPNQLGVTYREGLAPHEISELERVDLENRLSEIGVISQEKIYDAETGDLARHYILSLKEGVDLVDLQEKLGKFREIAVSEPNFVMELFVTPNDPRYSELWGLEKINAPIAWDSATNASNITVAVIDSGIDSSHPDLSANTISGRNFLDDNIVDDIGHGTHVAGIIGAIGNNNVGVTGVNWNIRMMPLRLCFSTEGTSSESSACDNFSIASAVKYAVDNGADVINMSLGGTSECTQVSQLQIAIDYALSRGVVVVAAAGNHGGDASDISPASCAGVITVGAVDQSDKRAVWSSNSASSYGTVVDIAAPGTGILSTIPNGEYKTANGTSMAAPYVAGAAALLLSLNPSLSPQQVASCLIDNADPISTDRYIGPRLNISNALSNCSEIIGDPLPSTTPLPTTRYYISGRIFQDNNGDGQFNSGDLGLINETLNLSGSFIDSTTTLTGGIYIFDNLFPGTFNITYSGITRSGVVISDNNSSLENLNFVVTKSIANPTPVVNVGPISTPIPPQASPTSSATASATGSPVPTVAPTYYSCNYDPSCSSEQKNIRLCALICTPKN